MRIYDIIAKKRDGFELTDGEIAFFVRGYTNGEIKDSQAAALLMAVYLNGMTDRETVCLTNEMAVRAICLTFPPSAQLRRTSTAPAELATKQRLLWLPLLPPSA